MVLNTNEYRSSREMPFHINASLDFLQTLQLLPFISDQSKFRYSLKHPKSYCYCHAMNNMLHFLFPLIRSIVHCSISINKNNLKFDNAYMELDKVCNIKQKSIKRVLNFMT